jgi:hypothetical protein
MRRVSPTLSEVEKSRHCATGRIRVNLKVLVVVKLTGSAALRIGDNPPARGRLDPPRSPHRTFLFHNMNASARPTGPRTAFQCLFPVWHHQQRPSPAPRSSVASRRARGRAVAGRGRKDGQADGRMGDDRGTHREGSVRSARSTPTERQCQIERQRSRIYPVPSRWFQFQSY